MLIRILAAFLCCLINSHMYLLCRNRTSLVLWFPICVPGNPGAPRGVTQGNGKDSTSAARPANRTREGVQGLGIR